MQSIALIDYGSGNLRSAEKALQKASAGLGGARQVVVTADPGRRRRGRRDRAAGRRRVRRLHGAPSRPGPA